MGNGFKKRLRMPCFRVHRDEASGSLSLSGGTVVLTGFQHWQNARSVNRTPAFDQDQDQNPTGTRR